MVLIKKTLSALGCILLTCLTPAWGRADYGVDGDGFLLWVPIVAAVVASKKGAKWAWAAGIAGLIVIFTFPKAVAVLLFICMLFVVPLWYSIPVGLVALLFLKVMYFK